MRIERQFVTSGSEIRKDSRIIDIFDFSKFMKIRYVILN